MTATRFGERFLRQPLPGGAGDARAGGRVAGAVILPGGPQRLHGLSPAQAAALARRFGGRWSTAAGGAAAVEVSVRQAPVEAFHAVDTRGWEYALDLDFAADRLRVAGLGLYAELAVGEEPLRAELWAGHQDPAAFAGAAENLLRIATAYRLLAAGGVMVHAAGVAHGGSGLLAVGRSGAGKSTLAAAAARAGATVLSDDLVALLPGEGGGRPQLAALPFTGDLPAAAEAGEVACAAMLRLEQAPVDALRPLGTGEALATLLACAPAVNADPYRREGLVSALGGLLAALPPGACQALRCTPAGGWPLAATLLAVGEGAR